VGDGEWGGVGLVVGGMGGGEGNTVTATGPSLLSAETHLVSHRPIPCSATVCRRATYEASSTRCTCAGACSEGGAGRGGTGGRRGGTGLAGSSGEADLAVAAEQTFGKANLRHRTYCGSKARPLKRARVMGTVALGLGATVRPACSSLPGSDVGSPEKTTTSSTMFVSGRV
jgi:hypothetical protein